MLNITKEQDAAVATQLVKEYAEWCGVDVDVIERQDELDEKNFVEFLSWKARVGKLGDTVIVSRTIR